MIFTRWALVCLLPLLALGEAVVDSPFPQEVSEKLNLAPELNGAEFRSLVMSRDDVPYVLTSRGVARVFQSTLALDRSFRPLADLQALDLTRSPSGRIHHLFPDRWLSNDGDGSREGSVPPGRFNRIAVGPREEVFLSGASGFSIAGADGIVDLDLHPTGTERLISTTSDGVWLSDGDSVWKWNGHTVERVGTQPGISLLAVTQTIPTIVTSHGWTSLNTGLPWMAQRIPGRDITSLMSVEGGWWVGTRHGAFFAWDGTPSRWAIPDAGPTAPPPPVRYYAGKRWLIDDQVVGIAPDSTGTVWILTSTGLQAIRYPAYTLAEKAHWFERKVRSRHIRYGLTAERRLPHPGDVTHSEMIDTDNDGGWSSYWLASQAFRYAVTHDPQARNWAWETFESLARLQTIHTNTGFPARTFERTGFKVSDTDRWHPAPDSRWEWKGTTSSDEIASHIFAYAVLWECAADSPEDRKRIQAVVTPIADHILDHGLYLVDVDGKPTLWGRWHPEYVNAFPPAVFDRRLNSCEIVALLQFAHAITGSARYREKAMELLEKHGYLDNIRFPMSRLHPSVVTHLGVTLGDGWNHSDDELAFITYWVLCRFALTPELRQVYLEAVAEHWQLERGERYPFWNFAAAGCGLMDFDVAGAVWTLRGHPLDTISWRMQNSHREDLNHLPPNFREQELEEILPPGERAYVRCNTQPFILDAGDGGQTEFAGDEYLLGYWMGRFVGAIGSPAQHP